MEGHSDHLNSKALGKGQQASTVLHESAILVAKLAAGLLIYFTFMSVHCSLPAQPFAESLPFADNLPFADS